MKKVIVLFTLIVTQCHAQMTPDQKAADFAQLGACGRSPINDQSM